MSEDRNTESTEANTEAKTEEGKVNMLYHGPTVSNPDVGVVKDGETYPVGEYLAKRLLISYGWEPGDEAARSFAEGLGSEADADGDEDVDVTGQQAADSGHQEAQGNLGEAQHESEGDPDSDDGEKGAGSPLEPGTGVPDGDAPDGDGTADAEEANGEKTGDDNGEDS